MNIRRTITATLAASFAALAIAACGDEEMDSTTQDLPQGGDPVSLDPADFTTEIDNPYWPMTPGNRWIYRETDSEGAIQRVEVTVTDRTKQIANGVEARVVHDLVTERGQPVEDTYDWYAQDSEDNLWYMGEDTKEFKNGKVASTAGSWEAGVDGAQPGIAFPAARKRAWPIGRSTTPARPRTTARSSASTSRPRCRPATTPRS